jgi:hypothetical protein
MRKDAQSAIAGVPGSVDQDVDPVAPDVSSSILVTESRQRNITISHRPEVLCERTSPCDRWKETEMETTPIEFIKKRLQEYSHYMRSQLRGHNADA